MSKKTYIDYEHLVQSALRSVVKETLQLAEKKGLSGDHHFYIAFATDHSGVDIPDYLKKQYPEEITIVLQHEYWDLTVEDTHFCVTLCFNDIHERLTIPFDAIISFVDPSVKFGLQFTPSLETPVDQPRKEIKKLEKNSLKSENKALKKAEGADSNIVTLDAFRKKP